MKHFALALLFCSGFLSEKVLSEKLESQEQLLEEKNFNLDDEAYNADPLPNNAACICRGGECVMENGKEVCKCPPGFGNFTSSSCKACNCGPDSNCMWETGSQAKKVCLCKPGYNNKMGKCVDCECGPDSSCEWISQGWFKPDKKNCICQPGYHDENGKCVATPCNSNPCKNRGKCTDSGKGFTCECIKPYSGSTCETSPCSPNPCQNNGMCNVDGESYRCQCKKSFIGINCETECDCSAYGLCYFENSRKKCKCAGITAELDGKCVECNCGENSVGCYYRTNRTKECYCESYYNDVEGYCTECDCGFHGICRIEFGRKKCICGPNFIESSGRCVAMNTTTSVTTGSSSLMTTVLPSTDPSCDCGEATDSCYLDTSGEKHCTCFSGYVAVNGYCAECDCGVYGLCYFEEGRKKCKCAGLTAEFDGKCVECNCGANSIGCYYRRNRTKECYCDSYYNDVEGHCTECDCGFHGICRIEFGRRKCICGPNFIESNGKCVDMNTTTSVTTGSSSLMTTVLTSTLSTCDCGEATVSCYLDTSGEKHCTCVSGYVVVNGYCAECNCGLYGSCSFETGRKKCACDVNYSERNGKCEYCFCGENSNSCSFDWRGDKDCNCPSGYAGNLGYCEECYCGSYGYCSFEYGIKQCKCKPFAVARNGLCVIMSTTTEPTTTEKTTILTSTTEECNCGPYGSCSFEYGRKKCNCRSFAVEVNGVCVDFGTTSKGTTYSTITSTIVSSTVQECDCGSRGRCVLQYGRKKCICDPFTSEKDGKCVGCYCGENSKSCHFNWKGDKVCNCTSGYAQVYGICHDCNCGIYAQSCFYTNNGAKVCKCDFGYTQTNGYCSAICSEDKCIHGKCEIAENDFKCRCNEGYTGQRCEEKIQIKSNKQDLWMVIQLSIAFATFILLSGMFCFWTRILKKLSKK